MARLELKCHPTRQLNSPFCWMCGKIGEKLTEAVYQCDRHPEGEVRWSRLVQPVAPLNNYVAFYGVGIPIDCNRGCP